MHIFISAYVLLALASWSALAVPLSASERNGKNGNSHMKILPILRCLTYTLPQLQRKNTRRPQFSWADKIFLLLLSWVQERSLNQLPTTRTRAISRLWIVTQSPSPTRTMAIPTTTNIIQHLPLAARTQIRIRRQRRLVLALLR
jgi:hypothetical protein